MSADSWCNMYDINEYNIPGDVKITINLEPHTVFKRNGLDLYMEKRTE